MEIINHFLHQGPDGRAAEYSKIVRGVNVELPQAATVLVVGGGGRCHAIVDALSRSPKVARIFCAPGNAGIASQAECVPIKDNDVEALKAFAVDNGVDLTVVGPEAALAAGIADSFAEAGLRIFAPSKAATAIESSKEFAKKLMEKYGIPTASYRSFTDYGSAVEYVRGHSYPVVLKYDGLAAGKGVVIASCFDEACAALKDMLDDNVYGGDSKVVIEEFLEGPEFSFLCFVDGERVYPMLLSQDHKRAYDGDEGPNTGGMGAYTGLPFVTEADRDFALHSIMEPVAKAMVAEGRPFKGVLYGGLMKCRDGIKVIEFNARFGDPETEVVLPRLRSDIYDIFSAVADGRDLHTVAGFENGIQWSDEPTIGVVMASKGYPAHYEKGFEIKGLERFAGAADAAGPAGVAGSAGAAVAGAVGAGNVVLSGATDVAGAGNFDGVRVYHMGTSFSDGHYRTAGGRVLIVVASAPSLSEARDKAYRAVSQIDCPNLFYRKDIGHWALSGAGNG